MPDVRGYILVAPFSLLSVASCTIMSLSIFFTEYTWSRPRFHYIFWLLVYCLSILLPTGYIAANRIFCSFQGVLLQCFSLSGILWTGFIALEMLYHSDKRKFGNKIFYLTLTGILLFSLMTALLPLNDSFYDTEGSWCWYENDANKTSDGFRYGFFYAILWAVIAWIISAHAYRIL